ncbi:MAG: ATP-dependent Clp protease adapter ClpS [Nesterenkonia sp.]|uniref:ATP-dependent Clp protease adapter ClpS n=1 Tax=Nesterenkonia marinintestina TaxID=2979865 RepID=UPI0021C1DF1A|nr:ATP-dependent Clp protease adapter ClpS [Nesterenkonia sp. GX14115]MDO5491995.1 ATP-dependent Clp protease adapter ClpS [Nesterenkonia sp.]
MSTAAGSTLTQEQTEFATESSEQARPDRPYCVVVWNDPVNLMSYVSWVFRSHFGHSKRRAHELMMQVHEQGRAVVSEGDREQAERDVTAMHRYGLQSTLEES